MGDKSENRNHRRSFFRLYDLKIVLKGLQKWSKSLGGTVFHMFLCILSYIFHFENHLNTPSSPYGNKCMRVLLIKSEHFNLRHCITARKTKSNIFALRDKGRERVD